MKTITDMVLYFVFGGFLIFLDWGPHKTVVLISGLISGSVLKDHS